MLPKFRSTYKVIKEEQKIGCNLIEKRDEHNKIIATYKITCPVTFGYTIANSIRRTILSTSEGTAVVAIKIKGAKHSFDLIEGIKETIQQIVLNLKNLYVKFKGEEEFSYLKILKDKPGVVKAEDFEENSEVEVVNKDLEICNLDVDGVFMAEVLVAKSIGYKTANEHIFSPELQPDYFAVDSIFSKSDCSYDVETNTGGKNNFDSILLQVTSNGDIEVEKIFRSAVEKLVQSFSSILPDQPTKNEESQEVNTSLKDPILDIEISTLNLSVRLKNCLFQNNIHSIGDLVKKTKEELMAFGGFGDACLVEVKKEILDQYGLILSILPQKGNI